MNIVGVDTNIVILIIIALCVNGPLFWPEPPTYKGKDFSVVTYWWTQRDCGHSLCDIAVERELNTVGNSADM